MGVLLDVILTLPLVPLFWVMQEIGKRCFIGAGSVIFQGVNIPDNTIVPAGSIIKQTI